MKTPDHWLRELCKLMNEDYDNLMKDARGHAEIELFKDFVRQIQEDARTKEK